MSFGSVGWWVGGSVGRSVCRSVSKWSVVGWLVVSGLNGNDLIKPIKNTKI